MFKDPELLVWVVKDSDSFAFGGGDFIGRTLEIHGVIVVYFSGTAQGEVEVEQGWVG